MVDRDDRPWRKRSAKNTAAALDWNPSPEQEKEIWSIRSKYAVHLDIFAKNHIQVIDRESARGAGLKPFVFNNCQKALDNLINQIMEFNLERSTAQYKADRSLGKEHVSPYPVQVVILKPRKVGVSTYLQLRAFHKCEFQEDTACLIMAHEAAAAANIMKISKRFHDCFVQHDSGLNIRQPIKRKSEDLMEWGHQSDAQGKSWGSYISVKTAGSKVSGTSRSFTWHFVHISEEAHFSSDSEVPPVLAARARACETYEESTANGTGGLFYNTWDHAIQFEDVRKAWRSGEGIDPTWNGKYQFFWSWLNDSDYRAYCEPYEREFILSHLSPRERYLVEFHKATPEQLKWRRTKIATECASQTDMDPEEYFNQEYPTEPMDAFVSRGSNVFQQTTLLKMRKAQEYTQPVWQGAVLVEDSTSRCVLEARETNPMLRIWAESKKGSEYIMGIDTAQGLKQGDWTVASLFERCNDELLVEVARFRAKMGPEETAIMAVHLAKRYNNAFIVPEANSPGNATCNRIHRLSYPMVYHRDVIEHVKNDGPGESFTVGFLTTNLSKAHLIAEGQGALRRGQIKIVDKDALTEWLHYKNDNGKCSAPEGENDDCVIADLLCCYGHFSGKAPRLRQRLRLEELDKDDLEVGDITQKELREAVRKMIKKSRKKAKKQLARESSGQKMPSMIKV